MTEMREPTFWILTVLATGKKHGYALIEDTRSYSDGRVSLKVATLYGALERLQEQGLVEAAGDEIVDGRLRRYFQITPSGKSRLEQEIQRMERNAYAARARIALVPVIGATS